MTPPRRRALLKSLLVLVIAATATVSFPGPGSAQAYPEWLIENVRAHGTANQLVITWEPPRVAKQQTVGTGDDATTIERATGVSRYVLRFENRAAIDVVPRNQGVDVTADVTGLEPGKRYHFSIQTCFDGTGGYSGCYLPEAYRSAYTAPKAPLFLSVDQARGSEVKLSWEGGNTVDRQPFDLYDYFDCQQKRIVPGVSTPFSSCRRGFSDRAKNVTVPDIDTDFVYEFRVRHKARSFRTRINVDDHNHDVAVNYEAGPWQTVTVGGKPKAPANLRITATTSTSVTLAWDPVTETTSGGALIGNVRYSVSSNWESFRDCETPDGQTAKCFNGEIKWAAHTTGTSATVFNLQRNRTYKFSVLSRTDHRVGQSTGWAVTSAAGRTTRTFPQNQQSTLPAQRKAKITVTAADPVTVQEGGASASYSVSLGVEPSSNVVVQTASDNADVTTVPASLTFTPDNWQTPQTVNVRAAHDGDVGDDTATISHTVSGADEYSSTGAPVRVAVSDDDAAGVTVSTTSLSLNEGEAATYTVVLDAKPNGQVLISPFAQHSEISAEPWTLTFTPDNWATPQTITVTAVQDDDTEDVQAWVMNVVAAFSGSGYVGVSAPTVNVSVTDDDEPQAEAAQQDQADTEDETESGTETESESESESETETESESETQADAEPVQQQQQQQQQPPQEPEPLTDRQVLEAFYESTGGAGWTNNSNWLSSKPLGQWHGVRTNAAGEVTHLALRINNLSGSLPAALGELDALEVLSLDRNSLSGALPAELGNLSNLTRLAMNRNSLSGAIPAELGNLSNLSIIGLARNQLSGSLPSSLGSLSGLTKVSLHDNTALSGALPAGFGAMPGLSRLAVSRTGLSGALPQGLTGNSAMAYLHFDDTSLCAPADSAFQTWLSGVPNNNGPTCE